jgi:MFS family permease
LTYAARSLSDIHLLLAAIGLNSLPLGYTLVVLPIYLSEIGFSGEVIGAITTAAAVSNTVMIVPFAIAADRYGRKKFVVFGMLSATLGYVLLAFMHDLGSLITATAIAGVGLAGGFSGAVWVPAWTALLAEKASAEKRTKAFAWSQGVWTMALTTGSAMGILPGFFQTTFRIQYLSSHEYGFLILAGLTILSGLVVIPLSETQLPHSKPEQLGSKKLFPRESLAQILRFSLTLGMVGLGSGVAVQLLSLWFNKMYGANETVLAPWFAAAEITSIFVVPVIPRLTRAWGSPLTVLAAQGFSAMVLGLMIAAPTYQLAGLLYIGRNFLMNISWPVQQSYLMGTVTPQERASASAITSMIWGIGASAGTLVGGYLLGGSSYISLSSPILAGGAAYLGAAIIFFSLFRRIPLPEEAPR